MTLQAVILAAGEGTRMRPLTEHTPKPLVKVDGKPLIEHVVSSLPAEVTELIIVVGYLGEQIKAHCGDTFLDRKVTYVTQEKRTGTAGALALTKPYLRDRFFITMADDILSKDGFEKCLEHDLAIIVSESNTPQKFGVVETNLDDTVKNFIEKPENPPSNLVSVGAMLLDRRIFDYKAIQHKNGEFYIVDLVNQMIHDHKVHTVKTNLWIPLATPEDIAAAEKTLRDIM